MSTATQYQQEYVGRINRAMDYIQEHLMEPLTLDTVSKAAGFSRFHFHRIFSCHCGETLNQYVRRLRVERAAWYLSKHPEKSITEIALDCGFSGSATFARVFKELMGMNASEWRAGNGEPGNIGNTNRNICKIKSKHSESFALFMTENGWQSNIPTWRIQMNRENQTTLEGKIEVKNLPDFPVVYVRHVGPYKEDAALFGGLIGKVCGWAGPRGLMGADSKILMVYHDDPDITAEEKLRVDVCLTVTGDVTVTGDIGKATIPGGRFAVGRFEVTDKQFSDAWDAVMRGFLPQSGFQPDDRPHFELYSNDPATHPENKYIVDICVPVRPL